ncbi:hypothetical protein ACVGVM_15055 [Pseudonocardia bannensis]|uniref:hypothetical protein n=1 Tax=Pseudonocardia bannensis TaxID=630973 RepID=UPI001FE31463|nr:hypothetical protein [Pseudonocardia bannensis]
MSHVVVDAANVVGSRPDGWWRDRAGAARRLAEQIDATLRTDPEALADAVGVPPDDLHVPLVLEGAARRAEPDITDPRLEIVRAPADGDHTIAELARQLAEQGDDVVVVTADRGLRERVRAAGARAVGPGTLLHALTR